MRLSGRAIIDAGWQMRLKDILHPVLMLVSRSKVHVKIVQTNSRRAVSGVPTIYAVNHSSFMDTPIALKLTGRSVIFSGKQNLAFEDWLFFVLNGVIWVDRKDKADMQASKDAVLAYLAKKQSVLWFPEGTWNLTENMMMMPMKWGIIDIAREAGAQIVPVALDYDRAQQTCSVRWGTPILPDAKTDHRAGIAALRDEMAALRWELWAQKPLYSREKMDMAQERNDLQASIREYPPIDWEYESSCIFKPDPAPETAFAHLQLLKPSRENAFLLRKRRA